MPRFVLETLDNNSKWKSIPGPPGFVQGSSGDTSSRTPSSTSAQTAAYEKLKAQRAWELAGSPMKQLPMQAIMLYMSGSGIQIFSIGIVFMLLLSPFKSLAGINKAFAPFAPAHSDANAPTTLILQKLAYLLANLLTVSLGLWKCNQMGLIPLGTADWLEFEARGVAPELTLL